MENDNFFKFLEIAGRLKFFERFSETPSMPRETVGAHSWRVSLMVMVLHKKLNLDIDLEKALKISIAHDIVESIAEDVDYILIASGKITKEEKYENEKKAAEEIKNILGGREGEEISFLWNEYANKETREGKFVYAVDKLEALISLAEAGYESFDRPEYIADYADEVVSDFPELKVILKEIKYKLKEEFEKGGFEWRDEWIS